MEVDILLYGMTGWIGRTGQCSPILPIIPFPVMHPPYPHCKSMLVPCGAGLTFVTGPKLHFGGRSTISRPRGGKISDADDAVLSVYARARKLSLFLLPSLKTGMALAVPFSVTQIITNSSMGRMCIYGWLNINLDIWKNATSWMRFRDLRTKFL